MRIKIKEIDSLLNNHLVSFKSYINEIPLTRIPLLIILSSALALFTELVIIRFHAGFVPVLAILKNISLLSCFLGLGIGFALGRRAALYFPIFPILFCLELLSLHYLVSLPNPLSEELPLGMELALAREKCIAIILVSGTFFLNAILFLPLGQLVGALMHRLPNTKAYRFNLIGSIAGIVLLSLLSFFWLGGGVWVACVGLMSVPFFFRFSKLLLVAIINFIIAACAVEYSPNVSIRYVYSPYQTLSFTSFRDGPLEVSTNHLYYQRILDLSERNLSLHPKMLNLKNYYELPYRFIKNPAEVLIVGSGTGNDIAAGLRSGAGHIRAVEIDPVIAQVGIELHPESPYLSPLVALSIFDARAFIRQDNKKYDAIIYGLLDSHTLLSGRLGGGIRLDSYVYTLEAFREARARLSPDGIISLSFVELSPEFGKKMFLMLKEAFNGKSPAVIRTNYDLSITFITGDNFKLSDNLKIAEFENVTNYYENLISDVDPSTDDWPFLYMVKRKFPLSYLFLWIPILIVSIILLKPIWKSEQGSFSWVAFFLGAAFMLLETKAFTEMALVCGATASVTSLVILFVLLAAFIANCLVEKGKVLSINWAFTGLLFSLCLSYFGTYLHHNMLPWLLEVIVRGGLLTIPIFFAGLCFSTELGKQEKQGVGGVFFANLLGAMLGGLIEYSSMLLGFQALYLAAALLYTLAFISAHNNRNRLP